MRGLPLMLSAGFLAWLVLAFFVHFVLWTV